MQDGSRFDLWTSAVIVIGYAIPGFLFAVLLVTLFAGGSFWQIFPLQGLVFGKLGELSALAQGPRLSVAHGAAADRHGCSPPSPC